MYKIDTTQRFEQWLWRLRDTVARAKILVRMDALSQGHFGDAKPLGGGLVELRIHRGPGYRIYLARIDERVILLLGGGDKSTQRRDIESARRWIESRNKER